ncbi:MAG: bifunctional nuclease family protein [Candidatus Omnitrophica bacterium]|nr:bifunctional nuclease family protein [Candidatus Omnitrophota bacterium]
MVQAELSRIVIDEEKREQVIVLKEQSGERILPIVIGINEAAAIKMKLSGYTPPRPLTHDLILAIMDKMGVRIEKIVIDNLVEGTFHAKLYLKNDAGVKETVDARPSDSIALAVRTSSPIFIEEHIFDKLS